MYVYKTVFLRWFNSGSFHKSDHKHFLIEVVPYYKSGHMYMYIQHVHVHVHVHVHLHVHVHVHFTMCLYMYLVTGIPVIIVM